MYKNSLKSGQLDAHSVSKILSSVTKQKPQGLLEILKAYKRLVEQKINTETVVVETGGDITGQSRFEEELPNKNGAQKKNF